MDYPLSPTSKSSENLNQIRESDRSASERKCLKDKTAFSGQLTKMGHEVENLISKQNHQEAMTALPDSETELLKIVLQIFRKLLRQVNEQSPDPAAGALLDRADVMRRLHVGRTTLYTWKKEGVLVPLRIGKRDYYREEDLRRFG